MLVNQEDKRREKPLYQMEMPDAFDGMGGADFSGMSGTPASCSWGGWLTRPIDTFRMISYDPNRAFDT